MERRASGGPPVPQLLLLWGLRTIIIYFSDSRIRQHGFDPDRKKSGRRRVHRVELEICQKSLFEFPIADGPTEDAAGHQLVPGACFLLGISNMNRPSKVTLNPTMPWVL